MKSPFSSFGATEFITHYHVWIVVVLSIVVLGGGGFFAILPKINDLREQGLDKKETREQALATLETSLAELVDAKKRFDDIAAEDLLRIERTLPTEKDVAQLLTEMPFFAVESGLTPGSIDISESPFDATGAGATASAGRLHRLDITMTVTGFDSYEAFKEFLGRLEDSTRILELFSLSYTPGAETYSFVFRTYYTTLSTVAN